MAFDYKKVYKEFYLPPKTPGIVTVPAMNFLAVRGHGNPNEENGAYKQAIGLLYAVAYTIKMSKMGSHKMDGYFDYVVPPLEGLSAKTPKTSLWPSAPSALPSLWLWWRPGF